MVFSVCKLSPLAEDLEDLAASLSDSTDLDALEGLLDELLVYMAPVLMGDLARPLLHLPLDNMAEKVPLQIEDMRRVGRDWRFTAVPAYQAD